MLVSDSSVRHTYLRQTESCYALPYITMRRYILDQSIMITVDSESEIQTTIYTNLEVQLSWMILSVAMSAYL
jgi:hypothetical protein